MWISRFIPRNGMQEEWMLELIGMLMFMKNNMKFYITYCFIYHFNPPLSLFFFLFKFFILFYLFLFFYTLIYFLLFFCTLIYLILFFFTLVYKTLFCKHVFYRSFLFGGFFYKLNFKNFLDETLFFYIYFILFILF